MDWKDIRNKLEAPFNYSDIKFRVGQTTQDKKNGLALAYVSNRAIMNRLDEVFTPCGWKNEFKKWGDDSQLCGISVLNTDTGEWITKWDGADDTIFEGTKGGLSASMKRAASQWGIGRYLYMLKDQWVPLKEAYGKYVLAKKPDLPSWAYDTGALSQTHISAVTKAVNKKGLTEGIVCSRYMKIEYKELSIYELQEIFKKLEKYEDVKEGEEPKLKVK